MNSISSIFDPLDWNEPEEIQEKGMEAASHVADISIFLQPLFPEYNKNVWDNCARILSRKSDKALEPYLYELLEWLQDMNWPGAFCILDRLQRFSDKTILQTAIGKSMENAQTNYDEVWKENLTMLADSLYCNL